MFTVVVSDVDGASSTMTFTMELTGDGEDRPDMRADPSNLVYEQDGRLVATADMSFYDPDPNQTHTVTVKALGDDYIGTVMLGEVSGGEPGDYDTYRLYDIPLYFDAPSKGVDDLAPTS